MAGCIKADVGSYVSASAQMAAWIQLIDRGYSVRVLKVARTIADLDDEVEVGAAHIAEALRCRPRSDPAPVVAGAGSGVHE